MLDIYKSHYRFKAHPFRLSPDHHFSLEHPSYARAKAYLKYAISQGEGFIAITGEPGTGKTTLINSLLAELNKSRLQVATLTFAQLDPRHLIQMVASAFGLPHREVTPAIILPELVQFLVQQNRSNRHAVLIVDEAQGMSAESLEELRLLSNLQDDNRLLMQIFLVGQVQLLDMIHRPDMEHLQQRLIAASHLEPLDLEETVSYVEHRLCHVGWQGDPAISEGALRLIHRVSGGVPRRINLMCHRLFLYGGLEGKHVLTDVDVMRVIQELQKERVLPSNVIAEGLSARGVEADAGETGAPNLGLPRAAETVPAEPAVQESAPATSHVAEDPVPPPSANAPAIDKGRQATIDEQEDMAAGDMAANNSANDKVMPEQTTTTAKPAGPATADTRHEEPRQTAGDHDGYDRKSGKRRLLPRLVLVVLLASLLLIQLIESRYYENGYLQETLTSLTSYIDRGLEAIKGLPIIRGLSDTSTAPDSSMPPAATMAPESATNAHPIDEIVATQKADAPGLDEPVTTVFHTGESGDAYTETTTTPPPGESSGAAESGLTDANPGFSSIEAELAANYLPVERLGNGHLLINLSSTGMFEFDSTRLSLSARAALTRLSEILGRHDGIGVHVVGHTDSSGHPQYNLRLSESRAKAVAEYLMTMGLPTDHIQSEGRGDLETRHEEATENQPELRRRVEIYLRPFTQE